jgi:hypothetical protein
MPGEAPTPTENGAAGGHRVADPLTPAPSPSAAACPTLAASYAGDLTGTVTGVLMGPVTGTMTLKLNHEAKTDIDDIDQGSSINLIVDGLPFTKTLGTAGEQVKCGVLDLKETTEPVPGTKVAIEAKCTFSAAGCTGTFTATTADGTTAKSSGTFELKLPPPKKP